MEVPALTGTEDSAHRIQERATLRVVLIHRIRRKTVNGVKAIAGSVRKSDVWTRVREDLGGVPSQLFDAVHGRTRVTPRAEAREVIVARSRGGRPLRRGHPPAGGARCSTKH